MLDSPTTTRSALAVTRLSLQHFRSYAALDVALDAVPVLLVGQNGAGKTNLLEAVSLLAPGKGLRGAALAEMQHLGTGGGTGDPQPLTIAAEVSTPEGGHWIATTRQMEGDSDSRRVKANGEWLRGQQGLNDYLGIIWLTPAMDGMLSGAAQTRRKYLDKIISGFLPSHMAEVGRYDYLMRERNQLLSQPRPDARWLASIEARMAESAVAIADQRLQITSRLRAAIETLHPAFPHAGISLSGLLEEQLLAGEKALSVESHFRDLLAQSRPEDARLGRTQHGTHRTDLRLHFPNKNQPMEACSTGEQKALMLSLTMAVAAARSLWDNRPPLVLMDEVVAHLDEHRRQALFSTLEHLGAQAWMTGTDAAIFTPLHHRAQLLEAHNCHLTRHW